MRPAQTIVLAALIGLSGCAGSIFYYEPFVDTGKDAQGNTILLDTPRMWADWTSSLEDAVASEAAGGQPSGGLPSWETHWEMVLRKNATLREHPQKYIDSIIEARRSAGLPELQAPRAVAIYEAFVATLGSGDRTQVRMSDVREFVSPSTATELDALSSTSPDGHDEVFSSCGMLDVTGCFDESLQSVLIKQDGGLRFACIVYAKQDEVNGNAVAIAYLVQDGSDWRVSNTHRATFEGPMYTSAQTLPTRACWERSLG